MIIYIMFKKLVIQLYGWQSYKHKWKKYGNLRESEECFNGSIIKVSIVTYEEGGSTTHNKQFINKSNMKQTHENY